MDEILEKYYDLMERRPSHESKADGVNSINDVSVSSVIVHCNVLFVSLSILQK
jgi:hypothetical protein